MSGCSDRDAVEGYRCLGTTSEACLLPSKRQSESGALLLGTCQSERRTAAFHTSPIAPQDQHPAPDWAAKHG